MAGPSLGAAATIVISQTISESSLLTPYIGVLGRQLRILWGS